MWISKLLYLWLYTLSSLITLASTSPLNTTSPNTPTTTLTNTTIPLISTFNPSFANLEKRQKKKHAFKNCDRVDVGRHNCDLMLQACVMFYEQFDHPDEPRQRGAFRKWNCKRDVCSQTKGDCFYHWCTWC
jgi:hypothetical protein